MQLPKLCIAAALTLASFALTSIHAQTAPSTAPATASARPKVGDTAKDFTLNNLQDKPIQLSTLLKDGPVVILVLRGWVTYQCPICNQQVGEFIAAANAITGAAPGTQVVLIYPGPPDTVKKYAQDFVTGKTLPANYHFVVDPDNKVVKNYGLFWNAAKENSYPSTFVVNKEGKITFAKTSETHGGRATAKEVTEAVAKLKPAN